MATRKNPFTASTTVFQPVTQTTTGGGGAQPTIVGTGLGDPNSAEYQAMPDWWKEMQGNIETNLNTGGTTLFKTAENADFHNPDKDPINPLPHILPKPGRGVPPRQDIVDGITPEMRKKSAENPLTAHQVSQTQAPTASGGTSGGTSGGRSGGRSGGGVAPTSIPSGASVKASKTGILERRPPPSPPSVGGGHQAPQNLGDALPNPFGDFTVGGDALSQLADSILFGLAGNAGLSDFGHDTQNALGQIIQSGGQAPNDTSLLEFEKARELIDKGRRTQLNSANAELAGRGTLTSGAGLQGPALSTIGRVEERLAPEFASAVRDILINQGTRADDRLQSSLALAAGLSSDQANRMLAIADSAGRRQELLANIAIDVLDRNLAWNQFLAQFGLERDKVMNEIQQGNAAFMIPLIQQFLALANTSAGGFF